MLRIEFGCVLCCNAEMPFMLWRKESLAGQLWLALSRRIFEPTAYLCYLGVSGHRRELTLHCGSVSALLGRTVVSWASFFYSPVICPRQFAWVRGCWFIKFFCAWLQFLPSSIIAILTFFSPTSILPYSTKLSRAVRLKHVHILPLQNNGAGVAHINV